MVGAEEKVGAVDEVERFFALGLRMDRHRGLYSLNRVVNDKITAWVGWSGCVCWSGVLSTARASALKLNQEGSRIPRLSVRSRLLRAAPRPGMALSTWTFCRGRVGTRLRRKRAAFTL